MIIKNKNKLHSLVQIFLNVTGEPHLEHIYLINNKFYLLRSISNNKSKIQKVRLIETDIDGNPKNTDDITTVLNIKTFKKYATIIGAKK